MSDGCSIGIFFHRHHITITGNRSLIAIFPGNRTKDKKVIGRISDVDAAAVCRFTLERAHVRIQDDVVLRGKRYRVGINMGASSFSDDAAASRGDKHACDIIGSLVAIGRDPAQRKVAIGRVVDDNVASRNFAINAGFRACTEVLDLDLQTTGRNDFIAAWVNRVRHLADVGTSRALGDQIQGVGFNDASTTRRNAARFCRDADFTVGLISSLDRTRDVDAICS